MDAGERTGLAEEYAAIRLPRRATTGSAGYDFFAPRGFTLSPGESIRIPTGIRVLLDEDKFLAIYPRSGLGYRYRLQLDNTVGIIDADYSSASNEGHIIFQLTNDSKTGRILEIAPGQAVAQGVIQQYFRTVDDIAEGRRTGGFGSTDTLSRS